MIQIRAPGRVPVQHGRTARPHRPEDTAMQFNIHLDRPQIDIDAVERLLQNLDPAGLADVDITGVLRVSTTASDDDLIAILAKAGHPIRPSQVERVASVCCGGCSG
ncbi:hypothetical protein [Luteimonas sp. FCS-9]|uniref:hypothetical protein n=1 Tax=Luteimonas sp. FCS-9 TaxID=1547516 RepID=UPI0012E069B9|nr:hypothetical protein [Luteimonas sp. FCS-9]